MIFTTKDVAPQGQLNVTDLNKILKNLAIFFIPVAMLYLTSISLLLQQHGFVLSDFIPNQLTMGSMVGYIINGLLDLLRKLQDNPQPKV